MTEYPPINRVQAFLFGLGISVVVIVSALGGAIADRLFVFKPLNLIAQKINPRNAGDDSLANSVVRDVIDKESIVIDVSEKASKSVVTVAIKTRQPVIQQLNPLDFFGFGSRGQTPSSETEEIQQDIGTGFVVDEKAGIIVTNRHVIDNREAEYLVIDKDGKEHAVQNFYRDPSNDIGIVKIDANLPALELGDSSNLRVGQSVIAIGTALGEFRHTVTTGVISGLGRGIDASDSFGLQTERLDDVIQTDAAINPGNSGGPLINSQGKVIGVNVAVAGGGQNIGFAIPINVIKESMSNFSDTGSFDRPFMGVQYQMISEKAAIVNEIPQGAYVVEVVLNSSAADGGIQVKDVITKFDGKDLTDNATDLAELINKKKIGDKVEVELWRDGEKKTVTVTLKKREE